MAIADEAGATVGRAVARFPDPRRMILRYDHRRDILTLSLMPAQPAVSTDVGGEGWVRIIPGTGEVVGLEVEDFRSIFLQHHSDLAVSWEKAATAPPRQAGSKQLRRAFLEQITGYFARALAEQAVTPPS